jgi:predicted dehydrogenase
MLTIAIVGTGWWGNELAKAAKSVPDTIELSGCYSLSAQECAAFRAAYGGKVYGSFDEILADKRVEAVFLATPHSAHWQQIIAVAKAKKHVFCEKPLALTVETASEAVRACEAEGVTLAVGHNRRFSQAARRMKSLIDSGECGKVVHVEANYSGNAALHYPKDYWRAKREENPGGAIAPMGLHMIDTMTWLLGPVARLVAVCKRQAATNDIDDTAAALFELANGVTVNFGSIFASPSTSILRLYGTKANLEARDNFRELTVKPADASQPEVRNVYMVDDTLQSELCAFADTCAGKAPYPVRPQEAVRNIAVMEAIRKSSEAGGAWVKPSA